AASSSLRSLERTITPPMKKSGFNAERAAEDRAWVERKQRLLEAAKHGKSVDGSPTPPLVGGRDPSLAKELGGAAMLYLFREIGRAHNPRPYSPREFEAARAILDDPGAERHRRFVAMAEDMNIRDGDKGYPGLVWMNLRNTQGDVMDLLSYASDLKAGRRPTVPERFQEPTPVTFSGNEPDAPATPTPASPWAHAGEFDHALKKYAADRGYDL